MEGNFKSAHAVKMDPGCWAAGSVCHSCCWLMMKVVPSVVGGSCQGQVLRRLFDCLVSCSVLGLACSSSPSSFSFVLPAAITLPWVHHSPANKVYIKNKHFFICLRSSHVMGVGCSIAIKLYTCTQTKQRPVTRHLSLKHYKPFMMWS